MRPCTILVNCIVEKLTKSGGLSKRLTLNQCRISLLRRNSLDAGSLHDPNILRLRVSTQAAHVLLIPTKSKNIEFQIVPGLTRLHSRLMANGKATVHFPNYRYQIILSDVEPTTLSQFVQSFSNVIQKRVSNQSQSQTQAEQRLPTSNLRRFGTDITNRAQTVTQTKAPQFISRKQIKMRQKSRKSDKSNIRTSHHTSAKPLLKRPLPKRATTIMPTVPIQVSRRGRITPSKPSAHAESASIAAGGGAVKHIRRGNKIFKTPAKAARKLTAKEQQQKFLADLKKYTIPDSFSDSQATAMQAILDGENVFLTGSAGTGKSHVLHEVLRLYPHQTTFGTACTGVASSAVHGMTVYTFAGIGLGKGSPKELLARVQRNGEACARINKCRMLIIDEISMISADIFDKLNYVTRFIRRSAEPFGGIQLILCGDFFQLPPVFRKDEPQTFAFESKSWLHCKLAMIELKKIFRQSGNAFQTVLNKLRKGIVDVEAAKIIQSRVGAKFNLDDGIRPTMLLTHKAEVDAINGKHLTELKGDCVRFKAKDTGVAQHYIDQLKSNCVARVTLKLKVGAQVTLLKNLSVKDGLCNGSRGVVTGFEVAKKLPIVRFTNGTEMMIQPCVWPLTIGGNVVSARQQIPLDLAWALSIHKSQGMSLDRVEVSLAKVFECGQAYVALSRARSLNGLSVKNWDPKRIKAHPKVVSFYERLDLTSSAA